MDKQASSQQNTSSSKKIALRVAINSSVGFLLIYIWSRFVDFGQIIEELKYFQITTALIVIVFFFLAAAVRAYRTKYFLKELGLRYRDALMINLLSQFLSFMIPVRIGEMTKSVYFNLQYGLPLGKAVTWVFLDRFVDFWVVLILIFSLLVLTPTDIPQNITRVMTLLLIGFTVAPVVVILSEKFTKKLVDLFARVIFISRVKKAFITFSYHIIEGFSVLRRSPIELLSLFTITVFALVFDVLVWLVIFGALGVTLGFFKVFLATMLYALTFIIPSAPGYAGSVEAAGLAIFGGIFGVEPNSASAAVVVFHILTVIALPIFGLVSLYFLKFDLSVVWRRLRGENPK